MIPRPRFVVKVTARFGRTGRDGAIGDDETIRVRVFPRRVRIQGAHIARRRRLETGVASACPSRPSRPLVPRAFPTDARPHARSVSLSHPRISGRSHVFYPLLSLSAPIHIRARRFVRSQSYLLSHDPSLIFP